MLISRNKSTRKIYDEIVDIFNNDSSKLKRTSILKKLGFKVFLNYFVVGNPKDNWGDVLYKIQLDDELNIKSDHIFNIDIRRKIQSDLKTLNISPLYIKKETNYYSIYTNYSCIIFKFEDFDLNNFPNIFFDVTNDGNKSYSLSSLIIYEMSYYIDTSLLQKLDLHIPKK